MLHFRRSLHRACRLGFAFMRYSPFHGPRIGLADARALAFFQSEPISLNRSPELGSHNKVAYMKGLE